MSVGPQVRTSANVIRTTYGSAREQADRRVLLLQAITVAWMLVECSVALLASRKANSAALPAFGSDSLVELLSGCIVLLQFILSISFDEKRADRLAASLLYVLAFIVAGSAIAALAFRIHPDTSVLSIGIAAAALIVMPILGVMKEGTSREVGSNALAADAMQSATMCLPCRDCAHRACGQRRLSHLVDR